MTMQNESSQDLRLNDPGYSMPQVRAAVAAWCAKHPAWLPIADIEDVDMARVYVQWDELTTAEKNHWVSEYGYNEFGIKRCKIAHGHITGDGQFHKDIATIQPRQNFCSVYQVGTEKAAQARARIARYKAAINAWLAKNPEWMQSCDFTPEGYELLSEQWDELKPEIQAKWGTPARYKDSGTKRWKFEIGFLCESGFFSQHRELPDRGNVPYEVVFQVGLDHSAYRTVPERKAKALSIQQPWAWLIANGHKDVENRTWPTKHRGEFYVHAGKKIDKDGYRWVQENFPAIALPAMDQLEVGGIVGKVVLTACHAPQRPAVSPWHFENCFAFSLASAQVVPFQPLKGQLNFFTIRPTA